MIGAIIGDTVGSVYEFDNINVKKFPLFGPKSRLTDDSIMTIAVAEMMQNGYYNDAEKIVETFQKWGRAYPQRGYGGGFRRWLFSEKPRPYGSFGNGSAMRISPVGWYANNEEEVKIFSKAITEVTHNHPEGIKGAEVTAMCVYYARIGKSKEFIADYVKRHYDIDFEYEDLRKNYFFEESCQGTVPQAIYCFLISKDFEDCIRISVSIGGDTDTLTAIACAIAHAYYKTIGDEILKKTFVRLPKDAFGCSPKTIWNNFIEKFPNL